jgi:hypothetical protein
VSRQGSGRHVSRHSKTREGLRWSGSGRDLAILESAAQAVKIICLGGLRNYQFGELSEVGGAPRCLEGSRSFSSRNQGDSYLVGDCSRKQADAQLSHRLEQLPKSGWSVSVRQQYTAPWLPRWPVRRMRLAPRLSRGFDGLRTRPHDYALYMRLVLARKRHHSACRASRRRSAQSDPVCLPTLAATCVAESLHFLFKRVVNFCAWLFGDIHETSTAWHSRFWLSGPPTIGRLAQTSGHVTAHYLWQVGGRGELTARVSLKESTR